MKIWQILLLSAGLLISSSMADESMDRDPVPLDKIPPSPVLAIDKALQSFELAEGFSIEAVVSEPDVLRPVVMNFDHKGRMWVGEMTSFMMPGLEAKEEQLPVGTIAVLEDTDRDGKVDKRTVFIDKVILPRAIAFVKGGIFYADHNKLYFAEVIESKSGLKLGLHEVVDKDYAKGGNLEHKPNSMFYAMDNWYYNAKSMYRYQAVALDKSGPANARMIYKNKYFKFFKSFTSFRGQWGMSMDDYGRLYHNGNSSPAQGEFTLPHYWKRNTKYRANMIVNAIGGSNVYPIRVTPGTNRAYRKSTLNKEGKLRRFTAASGNLVYRGSQFPEKYYGMSLTPSPAANLISARTITDNGQRLSAKNLWKNKEILASKDERFRPVNMMNAPDGSLYVLDIYHGILQHKHFLSKYLKRYIKMRGLDKGNENKGRIYRLRWKDAPLAKYEEIDENNIESLVALLSHPNAWQRDTARRLLIQKDDEKSITLIRELILNTKDLRAKLNASWTLSAMRAVDLTLVKQLLSSTSVKARVAGIALSEDLAEQEKEAVLKLLLVEAGKSYESSLQIAFVAGRLQDEKSLLLMQKVLQKFPKNSMYQAVLQGINNREDEFLGILEGEEAKAFSNAMRLNFINKKNKALAKLKGDKRLAYFRGKDAYEGAAACFGCHGADGRGLPGVAPSLVKSEWVTQDPEKLIKVLLHGLSGPITVAGEKFSSPVEMPAFKDNHAVTDKVLADIATYIRNSWGNKASTVGETIVRETRAKTASHKGAYSAEDFE